MYITKDLNNQEVDRFDWNTYFNLQEGDDIFEKVDMKEILMATRKHLEESQFKMTYCLRAVMKQLLVDLGIKEPNILELGAATGLLTRYLVNQYGGRGVLVDNNQESYESFLDIKQQDKYDIDYVLGDLFHLELEERFDIVCSFGLIEHFQDKSPVMEAHKKFVDEDGYILILVPQDTLLTRVFFEIHPEQNLGYRELLTEKEVKNIFKESGIEVLNTVCSRGYAYDFVAVIGKCIK